MYLPPRRQQPPIALNGGTGYLTPRTNAFTPAPMPTLEPILEPPPAKVSYLGTPPPVPVALPTPTRPRTVADNIPNVPTMDNMEMVRNAPMPESPSLLGRRPVMTEQRNVSGIESLPSQVPQQSDDINGLSNNTKYVRGQEAPTGIGQPRTLDPLSQARNEVGELKPLGFWGRLGQVGKGALLGVANSGGGDLSNVVGSAIGGGLLGGTDYLRKRQKEQETVQRANEISQKQAYDRQVRLDTQQEEEFKLGQRYKQGQIDNMNADNERKQEEFRAKVEYQKEQQRLRQEQLNLQRVLGQGKLDIATTQALNNVAGRLKDTGVPLPDEVADKIGLPRGTTLETNRQNPNKYNIVRFRDGRVMNYDKTTGQLTDVGQQDTPIENNAAIKAKAEADALASIQQDPNAPKDMTLNPAAAEFIKNNKLDPKDPDLLYYLKKAGINDLYIPITKSEGYNQQVKLNTAKTYLGSRPRTVSPSVSNTGKVPRKEYTQKDIEIYRRRRNEPGAREAFKAQFGKDPESL